MENMSGYRRWLKSVLSGHDPSAKDVEKFMEEHRRQRVYGSNLELIMVLKMDAAGEFAGTRAYLATQGFNEPSSNDLIYFHRKIKEAIIWRASIGLIVVLAVWLFLWWAHLLPFTG